MSLPKENHDKVAAGVRLILEGLGENPERDGLRDTPRRVADMYGKILDGNFADFPEMTAFDSEFYDGSVTVHSVPFYAFCEHHLSLFRGHFGLSYVPGDKIIGLSKFVRLFRHYCKRPTNQERLTQQVVDAMVERSGGKGAACFVVAEHTCMSIRGVQSHGARTTTYATRGQFSIDAELRSNFLSEMQRRM